MQRDMTQGRPAKIILFFFLPLFIGNLLQQLYSIVDAIIVGNFVGSKAFAAVGSSSAILLFATSILIGCAMGGSAVLSQLYGARRYQELRRAIGTTLIFLFGISVLIAMLGVLFLPQIIILFQMPPDDVAYASQFLIFGIGGLIFVGIYNAFAFILRAFGNSKLPLYFLCSSFILNIILDFIFVVGLHTQVFGVALATFIAQSAAALGCGIACAKHLHAIGFTCRDFSLSKQLFGQVAGYAILTALQQSLSSFGMMCVQGLVNTFGSTTMAAFAAASRIDSVANSPLQDIGNTLSTYTAQNKGAQEFLRIKKGFNASSCMIIVFSLIISAITLLLAPWLINVFISDHSPNITEIGVGYLYTVAPFYVLLGFIVAFYGFFRGLGSIRISIIMTIISQGLRVVVAYSLAPALGFSAVGWAIVIGWFLSDALGFVLYRNLNKSFSLHQASR